MDEKHLTRLKAQYYIDTLWPEEMARAVKIRLPKKFSKWFGQKVIVRHGQGNVIDITTLSGFESYLAEVRKAYYSVKPNSPYDFNFFPRWACGPIFQTEIDKTGMLFTPKQIIDTARLSKNFKFKINKRGIEVSNG